MYISDNKVTIIPIHTGTVFAKSAPKNATTKARSAQLTIKSLLAAGAENSTESSSTTCLPEPVPTLSTVQVAKPHEPPMSLRLFSVIMRLMRVSWVRRRGQSMVGQRQEAVQQTSVAMGATQAGCSEDMSSGENRQEHPCLHVWWSRCTYMYIQLQQGCSVLHILTMSNIAQEPVDLDSLSV